MRYNVYVFGLFISLTSAGDASNQIHFEGYQVSNQCMALVGDDCLIPTKDAPELGYVKESSEKQYVPDVFYKVSHLLAHLSHGSSWNLSLLNAYIGSVIKIYL